MDKFTRIDLISAEKAVPELAPLYENAAGAMTADSLPGPSLFGNQVRALAHNPPLLQALTQVYQVFAETQSLPRHLVELGVLVVSRVNACQYCLQHHTPLGHHSGLTVAQLQAVQDRTWGETRPLWSDEEWLIIQYAEQLTLAPSQIPDALFADLKQQFTDRQIVDLTMRLALCSTWNKFNDALRLDTETAFQHAFADLGLA